MRRTSDGESARTFFQTDRYFVVSNQWFFATRDDGDHGPYASREEAQEALHEYLRNQVGVRAMGWEVPGAQN